MNEAGLTPLERDTLGAVRFGMSAALSGKAVHDRLGMWSRVSVKHACRRLAAAGVIRSALVAGARVYWRERSEGA